VPYEGFVADGWSGVAEAFAHNIDNREDIGAGVSVFHKGKCVVDIAGGYFDKEATKPYTLDTLQLVFSTTKGVVATAIAMCVERGLLSYEEPVSLFWPEFAAHGKEHVTVAQFALGWAKEFYQRALACIQRSRRHCVASKPHWSRCRAAN